MPTAGRGEESELSGILPEQRKPIPVRPTPMQPWAMSMSPKVAVTHVPAVIPQPTSTPPVPNVIQNSTSR